MFGLGVFVCHTYYISQKALYGQTKGNKMTKLQKHMLELINGSPLLDLCATDWAIHAMSNVKWTSQTFNRRVYAVIDLAEKNLIARSDSDTYTTLAVKVGA